MDTKLKNIEIVKMMYKLDASGARDELNILNAKQQRLREQLVLSKHVT